MAPESLSEAPPWCSVSAPAQSLLLAAAQAWEDTSTSEQHIRQALAQPEVEMDVLVSAYRYYFYKNNTPMALEVATTVLDRIQKAQQWPTVWIQLKPLLLAQINDPTVRLYLSAYAASGLLLARLGSVESAQTIADQIQQLKAKEFGGELLLNILNPPPEDED